MAIISALYQNLMYNILLQGLCEHFNFFSDSCSPPSPLTLSISVVKQKYKNN